MPKQTEAQNSTRREEARVDCVAKSIERLVLSTVDPDSNDLPWPSEGNVETRRNRSRCGVAHVVGDPRAERGEAGEHSGGAEAEKDVSNDVVLSRKTRCERILVSIGITNEIGGHIPWMIKATVPTVKHDPAMSPRDFFRSESIPMDNVTT